MYFDGNYCEGFKEASKERIYVIDYARADVTGDGEADEIFLVGNKPSGTDSPYFDNIELMIQDGVTKKYIKIKFKENSGYNPTLFLGDFTGNKVLDILVSIDSGGSGAIGFYYIYSVLNNKPKQLFDFEEFNEKYKYSVNYKDNFRVEIISKNLKEKYLLDISTRGKQYLDEIYYKNGKLKKPIEGFVNPISGLYPIDIQRDGVYGLLILQKIAGQYNADSLGFVETFMEWDKNKFVPMTQMVSIYGSDMSKYK